MSATEFSEKWRDLPDGPARLRWARIRWQMRAGAIAGSAADAAKSLGLKEGTYRAYERRPGSSKQTSMDHQAAISFGRRFGVSWQWLLLGKGTPLDDQLPAAQERALKAMDGMAAEQQEAVADMLERFAIARQSAG